METIDILNIIETHAKNNQCIFILTYYESYCDPKEYGEYVSFIQPNDYDSIIISIVKHLLNVSKKLKFEFDMEFTIDEAEFLIDGYLRVLIKNMSDKQINFTDIKKKLHDELIDNEFVENS